MAHLAPDFPGDVSIGVSLPLKQLCVCSWCGSNVEERKKGEKEKSFCHSSLLFKQISKGSAPVLHTEITTSQPSPAVLSACVILCLANAFSGCSSISWRKGPVIILTEVLPCSGWVLIQCSSIPVATRQADLLYPIAPRAPFPATYVPCCPHLSPASKVQSPAWCTELGQGCPAALSPQRVGFCWVFLPPKVLGLAERSPRSTVWAARIPPIARAGIV